MVIGSRVLGATAGIPGYRRVGQITLDFATNLSSGYKCTDTQSGFRALNCNALRAIDFESKGYHIESDLITHLSAKGFVITEVPIDVRYEVPHKHKKHPITHGMDILGHIIGVIGYKRPLLSFGVPGAVMMLPGFFLGLLAFEEYSTTLKFPFLLSITSMLLLIAGLLLITTALILNSISLVLAASKRTSL